MNFTWILSHPYERFEAKHPIRVNLPDGQYKYRTVVTNCNTPFTLAKVNRLKVTYSKYKIWCTSM